MRINQRSPNDMTEALNSEVKQPAPSGRLLPLVLPLRHDREEFADWGWIRDAMGEIVYQAKLPCCPNSEEADEHRRNKTDPCQPRVDALLHAFECEAKLRDLMALCYSEANRLANHGSGGLEKLVMSQLYDAANATKSFLSGQNAPTVQTAD